MTENKGKKKTARRSFASISEASDFWDSHSVSDIWDETKGVDSDISVAKEPKYIMLEKRLSKRIWKISQDEGTTPDRLVNSWLREKTALLNK